jgi:hypothetical protein
VAYIRASARSDWSFAPVSQAGVKFREVCSSPPDRVFRARCRRLLPLVLVQVGELKGLIYASGRGGDGIKRTYIHFMETPPILACNAEGDQLYLIGGGYRVTRRGIEG